MRRLAHSATLASLGFAISVAAPARGQDSTRATSLPSIGSRVRVLTRTDASVTGRLIAVLGDSVEVQSEGVGSSARFAMRDVARLDVWRRGNTAATAGIIAGTAGAVLGGVAYRNWCRDYSETCWDNRIRSDTANTDRYDHSVPIASTMVIGGAVLGALLGYSLAPPQWTPVDLPVRLGVAPSRDGLLLSISIGTTARRSGAQASSRR